ncbi:MAG TPA: BTAD domain-containing putative transcriptional regulator [Pseudonocardiaceae bacterium]
MTVEFQLFGSVEARLDGLPLDIGHARQQCVLAALLVDANSPIAIDELIDRVWSEQRPHRVRESLHSYLTRLRRALADTGTRIARRGHSYLLVADPDTVDLHRFRALLTRAGEATDEQAAELFTEALALCRGQLFAGLDTPWLAGIRATVDKQRLAAELDHADTLLRRGREATLLPTLGNRIVQRPLDERLAGQFMLALYRAGRQAEALTHYERTRLALVEELGIDPSAALRELHQRILTADPTLNRPATDGVRAAPVPHQLPAAPTSFTGRTTELAQLSAVVAAQEAAGDTVIVSAVGGAGGMGKTWLTLHWAHRNLHRFPDGQLFVNLRGFDPTDRPTPPREAVRTLLDALSVDPDAVPADLDAQTALYRSLVADRRMLIVLDNAADAAQVVPLLPGSPTCTVLVTSRDRLTGLVTAHGARVVRLDVFGEPDARALLADRLGAESLARQAVAVRELLAGCAGLPLALGIVAGRARMHPEFPLAVLAEELRDATTRLGALAQDPHTSVRAVLSWSHRALPADAADAFCLLGIAPGADIGLRAAADLLGRPPATTRSLLRALERASLLDQPTPDRFRLHDLVRLYAAERADTELAPADRTAALRRVVGGYLRTGYAADRLIYPDRPPITLTGVDGSTAGPTTQAQAWAWFDAEHANLFAAQQLAAENGWSELVWQLAWVLNTFAYRRGRQADTVRIWSTALPAALRLCANEVLATVLRHLGDALTRTGQVDEALGHLETALRIAEAAGAKDAQARTLWAIGRVWERRGDDRRALAASTEALRLFDELDDPIWAGRAHSVVGWYAARLDEQATAREHLDLALAMHRTQLDREGEAATLDSLGYLAQQRGEPDKAREHLQQALALRRELGNPYFEADTLDRLGQANDALGDAAGATTAWREALRLYRVQHRLPDAHRVQRQLDGVSADQDRIASV